MWEKCKTFSAIFTWKRKVKCVKNVEGGMVPSFVSLFDWKSGEIDRLFGAMLFGINTGGSGSEWIVRFLV
jgi:ABC-type cobalt transport system substrate-binding protein